MGDTVMKYSHKNIFLGLYPPSELLNTAVVTFCVLDKRSGLFWKNTFLIWFTLASFLLVLEPYHHGFTQWKNLDHLIIVTWSSSNIKWWKVSKLERYSVGTCLFIVWGEGNENVIIKKCCPFFVFLMSQSGNNVIELHHWSTALTVQEP